ncbi:MurR/RpiR family transcriptional regulator [Peribacillus sp. JNUCC 23]|uniref:MurR/RpiR family transcriptional regulator n=1 Tax=Peribacillus sp. NPDC096379 TaxID=3364393 RepID=UPI0038030A19
MNIEITKNLTKKQQIIADYITKQADSIPFMTEKDISTATGVSIATVSRFWEAIGYESFKAYKMQLKKDSIITPASKMKTALEKYEQTRVGHMLRAGVYYLEETSKHMDNHSFYEAIKRIVASDNIHLYGSGSAECLTTLLQFRLKRFGMSVQTMAKSGHELFEDLVHCQETDILIIFGFVQTSPEIRTLFDYARKKGCQTVLITDLLVSPMIEEATYTFFTERGDMREFHSMVAAIAFVESMIIAIGKQMGEVALTKLHELQTLRKVYAGELPKN